MGLKERIFGGSDAETTARSENALSARSHAERVEALAAYKRASEADLEKTLARLASEQQAAREQTAARIGDAEKAVADLTDALEVELTNDLRAELYPLVAVFTAAAAGDSEAGSPSPRKAAVAIAECWTRFRTRATVELAAADLVWHHLMFAFLATISEDALARGGSEGFLSNYYSVAASRRIDPVGAIERGEPPAVLVEDFCSYEAMLGRALSLPSEADPRRLAVLQRCASQESTYTRHFAHKDALAKERAHAEAPFRAELAARNQESYREVQARSAPKRVI